MKWHLVWTLCRVSHKLLLEQVLTWTVFRQTGAHPYFHECHNYNLYFSVYGSIQNFQKFWLTFKILKDNFALRPFSIWTHLLQHLSPCLKMVLNPYDVFAYLCKSQRIWGGEGEYPDFRKPWSPVRIPWRVTEGVRARPGTCPRGGKLPPDQTRATWSQFQQIAFRHHDLFDWTNFFSTICDFPSETKIS